MAVSDATKTLPELQIEAVLSVPPLKMTEPRRVRQVLMSDINSVANPNSIGGCYQIVLYYDKLNEKDSDKFIVGWIVESLGTALVQHPLLAGRLQRKKDIDNKGEFEIVSNDSGIRLYEARFPIVLSEFLALMSEKEHLEAQLVFWNEIDHHNPEFSPLFYVQVTQFECRGYTIGISCSFLLADVLIVENFLKTWTEIHNNILPQNEEIKAPIYYHPRLIKNNEPHPSHVINPSQSKKANTLLFNVTSKDSNFKEEHWRELAMLCLAEADQKLHKNVWTDFNVFVKESSEVIKVEGHSKSGYSMQVLNQSLKNEISGATSWNDFGDHVTFHEGNKPVLVSRWIGSIANGHVMVVPCTQQNENVSAVIIVSFPFEEEL